MGQHLVKELDDSIKKRPTATKLRLTENLRECLNEMPHAETMLSHKLAELEKTPGLYDARSPLIREAIAAAEDTLGGLIELLGTYYPETLAGNIRTTNGPLAVSELVLKYLPGFHDLNKKIRSERAVHAPVNTEPPQPGSPAPSKGYPHPGDPLDTPPPPLTERLPIDDVLAMPRTALDRILLDAAMIEPDTIPGRYKAKPTVKPWQWANVRAALQTKLLLAEINDLDAARLFAETYGAIVGRGTMQKRPQNEQNKKLKTRRMIAYAEFRDRLPASNPS